MEDLQSRIQHLASELRSVEDILVAEFGIQRVTGTMSRFSWHPLRHLRALFQFLERTLAALFGESFVVRAPQAD